MTVFFDRVRFYTPTVGSGATVAVGAVYDPSFLLPAEAGCVANDSPDYVIRQGMDVEVGQALMSVGATAFIRTVTISKIGGVVGTTPITLMGDAEVFFVDSARLLEILSTRVVTLNATTTLTADDNGKTFLLDATAGAFTVNLPPLAASPNCRFTFYKTDVTSNAVTFDPNGAELVDAAATVLLNSYGACLILFNGVTAWRQEAGPLATTGRYGLTALASTAQVLTGTLAAAFAVTPDALAALWEKNATLVTAAATVSLGEGGYFHFTGATPITDIDWATPKDGRWAWVYFESTGQLVHSTGLVLPGAANITTGAGDRALFIQDSGDQVLCAVYVPASGKPVVMPNKTDVGLGNVDNTSDANKPVSTAQAAADALRVLKAGDTMSGFLTLHADPDAAMKAATKQYVDNSFLANDAMIFKGVIDCSANPNYPAADRGHTYRVSVAGKIGGASGPNVEAGDLLICITDGTASGNHATVGANWTIVQANLDGAVIGPASATSGNPAVFSGTSGKVIAEVTFGAFKTSLALTKGDVGLGNVDNTSDLNKPVSTATQTALNLKADLASPTFTGDPKAPTPSPGDNDTSIATTAFVTAAIAAKVPVTISDTAPSSPLPGQLWWESDTGDLYVRFDDGTSAQWVEIGAGGLPPATTTEVLTGTELGKAVTPDALAALWETAPNIASATTLTLGDGGAFNITGATAISSIVFTNPKAGRRASLRFLSNPAPLLNNSGTLQMPGGTSHQAQQNDRMEVISDGVGVYVFNYFPADGDTMGGRASTTDILTGTDTRKAATPDAIAALWELGAALTTAADVTVGEGGYFVMTGAGTVNSLQFATKKDGRRCIIYFNTSGIVLKSNVGVGGTGIMLLPGNLDYTTAAGDVLEFVQSSTNYMICINAQRADAHSVRQGDFIEGLNVKSNAADLDQDIDIDPGSALDQVGGSAVITLASTLVKRCDAVWAAGTNQGGVDTGTLPTDGTVHLFVIRNPTSGVVDAVFSASLTPALPSGYTQYHRVASFTRAAGVNRRFYQVGDHFFLHASVTEYSTLGVRAWADLVLAGVPNGIKCTAHFRTDGANAADGTWVFKLAAAASVTGSPPPAGFTFNHLAPPQARNTNWFFFPIVSANRTVMLEVSNPSATGSVAFWGLSTIGWIDQRVK